MSKREKVAKGLTFYCEPYTGDELRGLYFNPPPFEYVMWKLASKFSPQDVMAGYCTWLQVINLVAREIHALFPEEANLHRVGVYDMHIEAYKPFNGGRHAPKVADEICVLWFDLQRPDLTSRAREYLRNLPYQDYLKTHYWRKIRGLMLLSRRITCQQCGASFRGQSIRQLQVHHLTYKNRARENFSDLQLLCSDCHRETHGMERQNLTSPLKDIPF